MQLEQYKELQNVQRVRNVLKGSDLKNQFDRTLLWGYTCERNSWHVYLRDGIIFKVVYDFNENLLELAEDEDIKENEAYVPDKRLYPEACDFEFCELLKEAGVNLPFTTFNKERAEAQFHGKLNYELARG